MNGQELATAAHYSANILFLVINNGLYGSVRMHQELRYPGRPYATGLTNPDFAALAASYGLPSASVTTTAELTAALDPMITNTTGPRLIEIRTDPEEITPAGSINDIRKKPAN
jgi:acetolactate synthase-1/2/3 large subunit